MAVALPCKKLLHSADNTVKLR